MGPVRHVISARWVTDFLQHLLDQDRTLIILVVCAARDSFIEQLLATMHLQLAEAARHHQLLTKTLSLLSKSHNVRTVFCPTLEHIRAYLSAGPNWQILAPKQKHQSRPLLAILNPLCLHLSAREFSAQGLSRTLANAVEVSSRATMDIVLCECQDSMDPASTDRGEALWYVDVPLLSNSLRIGTEGNNWTGHVVPVKRVVQRWFEFTDSTDRESHS